MIPMLAQTAEIVVQETRTAEPAAFVGCFLVAIFLLVGLGVTAFWVWMLVDAIQRCPSEENLKLIWVLVIVLVGPLGALIYAIVQRPKNPPAEPPPMPPP